MFQVGKPGWMVGGGVAVVWDVETRFWATRSALSMFSGVIAGVGVCGSMMGMRAGASAERSWAGSALVKWKLAESSPGTKTVRVP